MTKFVALGAISIAIAMSHAALAIEFAGDWVNIDVKTKGLTRIEVYELDSSWSIRAWAATEDGEADQGQTTLDVLGDSVTCFNCRDQSEPTISKSLRTSLGDVKMRSGFAHWDYGFKDTYLTLRLEEDRLIAEDYNIFKDESGRTNYRARYEFQRAKKE
jgi:hypothetical protein